MQQKDAPRDRRGLVLVHPAFCETKQPRFQMPAKNESLASLPSQLTHMMRQNGPSVMSTLSDIMF